MTEDKEAFLERWSRRKLERAEEKPAPLPEKVQQEEPAVVLPPVEELKPDSDFVPFMHPKVDGETRRAALKKLFADAHYNVPDPFEAYSEDYTVSETIPMEMLRTLNHAQKLLFDKPEKNVEAAATAAVKSDAPKTKEALTGTSRAEAPQVDSKDAVGKQDA